MKKKILILMTILALSLTACNGKKASTTTPTESPVKETEISNDDPTDKVIEEKETDTNTEEAKFNSDEIISEMKKEFINQDTHAELRSYDIVIENNKIRIEAVVEEGTSEETAKNIGIKSEEKLDELLKNENKSLSDFNLSIEITEDYSNNLLYSK